MNKQQFLEQLKSKLRLLEENEIKDILEEYSTYIDDAIKDGKSEEAAIHDFGNLNELAKEILSAYKINTKKVFGNKIDAKQVDGFINDLSSVISNIISYFVSFFEKTLKDFSPTNASQIFALVIVGLILIMVANIPFFIIKLLGNLIISIIIPIHFIEKIIIFLWGLLLGIAQLLLAIFIIVSLIKSGSENKSISETVNDLFKGNMRGLMINPTNKKVTPHSDVVSENSPSDEYPIAEKHIDETTFYQDARQEFEKDYDFDLDIDEKENKNSKQKRSFLASFLHLIYLFIAGCIALSTLPLFLIIIGLGCILAMLVYLITQGVNLYAFIIFIFGLILLLSSIADAIIKFVGFSKMKFKHILFTFIASIILIISGGFGTFITYADYEIVYSQSYDQTSTFEINDVQGFVLPYGNVVYHDVNFSDYNYNEYNYAGDYKVVLSYSSQLKDNIHIYVNNENRIALKFDNTNNSIRNSVKLGKEFLNNFIENLKQEKIYATDFIPFKIDVYKK